MSKHSLEASTVAARPLVSVSSRDYWLCHHRAKKPTKYALKIIKVSSQQNSKIFSALFKRDNAKWALIINFIFDIEERNDRTTQDGRSPVALAAHIGHV